MIQEMDIILTAFVVVIVTYGEFSYQGEFHNMKQEAISLFNWEKQIKASSDLFNQI